MIRPAARPKGHGSADPAKPLENWTAGPVGSASLEKTEPFPSDRGMALFISPLTDAVSPRARSSACYRRVREWLSAGRLAGRPWGDS